MRPILFAAAALLAAPAAAATADPDAFASGTDISNAFAGVSLLTVFTGADPEVPTGFGAVYSLSDPDATTGTRAFGHSQNNSTWGNGDFEYLLATFGTATNSVSLDFFANDAGGDVNAQLLAYNSSGVLIGSASAALVNFGAPVTLTVNVAGIKFVRAYWDEIGRVQNGGLDNLRWNAVPEPATWAMMIGGFGFVGAAMRRRTSKVVYA
jgi:hypothetical protein